MGEMSQGYGRLGWYLEGFLDDQKIVHRVALKEFPFRVGRVGELGLAINSAKISRIHAELFLDGEQLVVSDLGSTNGTFVNKERIAGPVTLSPGDIVHFGTSEFRVGCESPALFDSSSDSSEEGLETLPFTGVLPAQFITGAKEFLQMMELHAVTSHFQPLIRFQDGNAFAYEILGRGALEGFLVSPGELFPIASSLGLEDQLSRLFRAKGVMAGRDLPGSPGLFMNIHPAEVRHAQMLVNSLRELREENPNADLTLEIHEGLVTDLKVIRELRTSLLEISINLAYDDFGAGQARLIELAEVPPEYLKFDMSLVKEIHRAPTQRQKMVEMLVGFASDAGVICIAEGVECAEEAEVCRQLGFHVGQGYYFGRPCPCSELIGNTANS